MQVSACGSHLSLVATTPHSRPPLTSNPQGLKWHFTQIPFPSFPPEGKQKMRKALPLFLNHSQLDLKKVSFFVRVPRASSTYIYAALPTPQDE